MIVATPGGAETRHLVDARVLAALGPTGFLVNIARGSVVDKVALIEFLKDGRIEKPSPPPPASCSKISQRILQGGRF
jgi:lactate dehydrogenase-like 2-hydroxyacid dehydrogenase